MNLPEYEGAALFEKYGIPVPPHHLISDVSNVGSIAPPVVLKAQVLSGDRKKAGGILNATTDAEVIAGVEKLLGASINGEIVEKILVAEKLSIDKEYYLSFSYDTDYRSPVLNVSVDGGSGIEHAHTVPIDIIAPFDESFFKNILETVGFPSEDSESVSRIAFKLWQCFIGEYALLAEINPLIKTKDGTFFAADAKVILDDEKVNPGERRFIDMDGDIAILASGGGASLLNIDTLFRAGGKPANYTEYSGNPPRDVVKELTERVLSKKGLKGCWVVGGTANFTDIFETLSGFVEGLRAVTPKPTYPIVIRRDGPRQEEAFAMLRELGEKEGYDFHLYGRETDMAESARVIARLTSEHT